MHEVHRFAPGSVPRRARREPSYGVDASRTSSRVATPNLWGVRQHSPPQVRPVSTLRVRRGLGIVLFLLLASIDNTILGMIPVSLPLIAADLGVGEAALGLALGVNLAVIAASAVLWGYASDRFDRRTVLVIGTLAWTAPVALLVFAASYTHFAVLLALAGVGLGGIMTAGYSVMSDLVGPRRRGLLLGLWGGLQSIGAGVGPVLVGSLATATAWQVPFVVVAVVASALAGLTLFAVSPQRGGAELGAGHVASNSRAYEYRIGRADLLRVLSRHSNRWLMLQGFFSQLAFGALQWLPALLTAKLLAQGLPLATAASIGALLFPITQIGGVFGILGGYLGDRLQRRSLRARPLLAGWGLLLSVPAYLVFFWLPLPIGGIAPHSSAWQVVVYELTNNPYFSMTLAVAVVATSANAVNAPNWYALVTDVNLPEQRGTAFSLVALANSAGRALGSAAAGVALSLLSAVHLDVGPLAGPTVYALGLTFFVLGFVPAGAAFLRAATSVPNDTLAVWSIVAQRAAAAATARAERN